MSANNGVIRIGRKGLKKFAFGEEGAPFEVDVVQAFQQWLCIDEQFREHNDNRTIETPEMPQYHQAAVDFATTQAAGTVATVTIAEALDFIARLREQYDEVAAFFQPRSRDEPDSPGSSGAELRFSAEAP